MGRIYSYLHYKPVLAFTLLVLLASSCSRFALFDTTFRPQTGLTGTTPYSTSATRFLLTIDSGSGSPLSAGTSHTLTVSAYDNSGNIVSNYTGTIQISSSDSKAVLPGNYTFSGADSGVHTLSGIVLKTAGTQSLKAMDIRATSLTGTQSASVLAGAASTFTFAAEPSSSATAGVALPAQPQIQLVDAYGNMISSGSQTVTLTAYTDAACTSAAGTGTLSSNSVAASNGKASFTNVSYTGAGVIYLGASSSGLQLACSSAIVISAGSAAGLRFSIEPPATVSAGSINPTQPQVEVVDAFGNLVSSTQASVSLDLYSDNTCSTLVTGVLTTNMNPITTSGGFASFSGTYYSSMGTYYLGATATGFNSTCSSLINVTKAHSVTLSWNASTSVVSGYKIYRSSQASGPFNTINSGLITGLTYIDTNVQAGQTYYYQATAVDASNSESVPTPAVQAVIPTP